MASWSTRRKYSYLLMFAVALVILFGVPSFFFLYRAPTCFDNKQNGTETGIDCGGVCTRLCPADFAPPRVMWSYSTAVVPGVYNSLAYAQNPNPSVEAVNAPYLFKLYDDQGILIAQRTGAAFIPAGQKFAVFEGGIQTGQRIPARTTFEFLGAPEWRQGGMLSAVRVENADLTLGASPRAEVHVTNDSVDQTFSNVQAVIILYDKDANRVAFSKTVIDSIAPGQKQTLVYTWSAPFSADIVKTEVLFAVPPTR